MNSTSAPYVHRAIKMIWDSSRKWSIFNIILITIRGLMPMLMLWVVKMVVDITIAQISQGSVNFREITTVLVLMGGVFVLSSVASSLHSIVKNKHSYLIGNIISSAIQNKSTQISYQHLEAPKFQDVFFRAIGESSRKPQEVFFSFIGMLQNCLTLCVFAAVLMSIHWVMPIAIMVVGIPIVIIRLRFSRKYFELLRSQTTDERRVHYYNHLLTSREYAKEVRIFDLADHFKALFVATKENVHRNRHKQLVSNAWRELIAHTITAMAMVAVFGFVIKLAIQGSISVGDLAMYLMALHRCSNLSQTLLENFAHLYDSSLFLRNLFDFIDLPISNTTAVGSFATPMRQGILFENVSFRYANTSHDVIKNINLTIPVGQSVAIVGSNGSGKSTFIKLICGLYEPTEGRITIDGVDMHNIPRAEIAKNVSAIFQDFMLYNASAADNIWYGDITANKDEQAIQNAAANAGIDNVFRGLKNGYETPLGHLTPDSEMLSRGEWQRTALARSFFSNAQIIVLDEPTSSLDAFMVANFTNTFRSIIQNRTSVIVSHRLATIRLADVIIVLNNHGIAEMGSYNELLEKQGLFFQMAQKLS
ncbi:MAG: ABC transporter ATP-binding protein [Bacteroidales bacterium]|nr:ABC transporter ATP-binding protein [Bacteroidales bacterium]